MDSLIGLSRPAAQLSFIPQGHKFHLGRRAAQLSFIILMALAATCLANQSKAQETIVEPWALEAGQITFQNDPQKITANGEVVLRHNEKEPDSSLEIRADSIIFHNSGSTLDAQGNVFLKQKDGEISATSILFGLQDHTGKLTGTTISPTDNEINFSGQQVEMISESRYIFYDGRATSCLSEPNKSPAWSINWRKADITVDGMAYLQGATFNIKKMPLLYFPFLALPAKITRQTGFLFPEISNSGRDGIGTVVPLFVNLSPSSDLTFCPGYCEKRGSFSGFEFRNVTDNNSRATLAINYLYDRTEDQGQPASEDDYRQDGYLRTEHTRYWLRAKADHYFRPESVIRVDVDVVSDQDYLTEYRGDMTGFTQSNQDFLSDFSRGFQEASLYSRESILQFSSRGKQNTSGLEIRHVTSALTDPTASEPLQTLPRMVFNSRLPLNNLPFSFDWSSGYVQYRPQEGIGYQRLDLAPHLVMPLPFGPLVEGTIAGGLSETMYRIETVGNPINGWDSTTTQNRNSWDLSANIAAVLARDFTLKAEQQLTHTFRPNLSYNYRESRDQSELPNFDSFDRLIDNNILTAELNNYFQSNQIIGQKFMTRQLGYLKFNQSYDLGESNRTLTGPNDKRRPFSNLALDLEISPLDRLFLRYQTTLSVYGQGINSYHLQSRYSNSRQDNLTINYDYLKGSTRNMIISSKLKLTAKLVANYSTTRSLFDNHATDESIGLQYNSQCWGVELSNTRNSEDRRLMLTFSLTGIGESLAVSQSKK